MNKAHTAKQPSIEDLLASIRQAIHDDVAPDDKPGLQRDERPRPAGPKTESLGERAADADEAAPSGAPAPKPVGREAEGRPMQRTIVTSGGQGFAGLLGGDVRLEEALARLSHAGRRPAAASQPSDQPRLRPAIDEPVERLHSDTERSRRAAGAPGPVPPVQSHEPPDADPPWLRPERSAASGQATGAACESAPSDADPLWHDASHEAGHPALSPPDSAPESHEPGGPSDLLSSEAAAAASSAFNRLADAIVQRSTGGERSLEEVTRELLRPMLKSWLDQNLPPMVEQLVREEIARVARNGK